VTRARVWDVCNPKGSNAGPFGRVHWYPYYAGYSALFVDSILKITNPDKDLPILDPWNGSGTTTAVCALSGRQSTGFDLNPVMILVAKARLLQPNVAGSLKSLVKEIVRRASADRFQVRSADPLSSWFSDAASESIRKCERAIRHLLVGENEVQMHDPTALRAVSSLAAFFYVLLFRSVRRLLGTLRTTNPTWVPSRKKGRRIVTDMEQLYSLLIEELQETALRTDFLKAHDIAYREASIQLADSRLLPVKDESIGAVITSPPYCTRIDYAVATRVELAVLGYTAERFESLRRSMIGTTLSSRVLDDKVELTPNVINLIDAIRSHRSKASASYYYSTYKDYFVGLSVSLKEVHRVLAARGSATFVVQDSLYKEIHVDLAKLTADICETFGLILAQRLDFPCKQSMRGIHPYSADYKASWVPTESVLTFKKAA
jgi:DNA modification methylase